MPAVELSKEVAYAAAMRICRFTTANEFDDWMTVVHTFTYGNAIHQMLKRVSRYEGVPPLNWSAAFSTGRCACISTVSSNIPSGALPGERGDLDDLPTERPELLQQLLLTVDRQAQINEAGRIVARYLALRHPPVR